MLSYNEIRKFEAGTSFRWTASIIGGPGPISNEELNLLGGKFIPAQSIEISDIELVIEEIPVTSFYKLPVPGRTAPIEEVTITFTDNSSGAIRAAIKKWIEYKALNSSTRVPDITKFYKLLKIDILKPDHTVAFSRILYIIPKDKIDLSRDSENEVDEYKVIFLVVGED